MNSLGRKQIIDKIWIIFGQRSQRYWQSIVVFSGVVSLSVKNDGGILDIFIDCHARFWLSNINPVKKKRRTFETYGFFIFKKIIYPVYKSYDRFDSRKFKFVGIQSGCYYSFYVEFVIYGCFQFLVCIHAFLCTFGIVIVGCQTQIGKIKFSFLNKFARHHNCKFRFTFWHRQAKRTINVLIHFILVHFFV